MDVAETMSELVTAPGSTLETRIRGRRFAITAEIAPSLSGDGSAVLREAELLRGLVDGIAIVSSGSIGAASTVSAAALLAAHGYEPVLQVVCRDRNRNRLAGDLVGAVALGVRNVLVADLADSTRECGGGAHEEAMTPRGVIALAHEIRSTGRLPCGRQIDPPPQFLIGASDLLGFQHLDRIAADLAAKLEAGADFVQTRLCFDLEGARLFMRQLTEKGIAEKLPIIFRVSPIRSSAAARALNMRLGEMQVPEEVIDRLHGAYDEQREGRKMCADLIEALHAIPGVAGVHLAAPGLGTDAIAGVLELLPSGL